MFDSILIANRGEIACRIIRTARRMGIATVAVYSDADADALHVDMANEALRIGPAPADQSYLDMDAILAAAEEGAVDAVHPGYGFLSENAVFAERLGEAGITFIGPDPPAIRLMGDKIQAKKLAGEIGVPIVPGGAGELGDLGEAREWAAKIGYPVMLKASAGGGGKGMRMVADEDGLADALLACRSEAGASFGDERMLIEKFIARPRHIEIQVLADRDGKVIHLGERECSIQRRHQKVIEEAPSPFVDADMRAAMGAQAVALAEAVNYVSAGTVEFIVGADRQFYFLEMNTRLQVEHPVTEQVTGLDLVEQMIRIAAGEPLGLEQSEVKIEGWAMEARVYAEDPARGFLPATGRLIRYREPLSGVFGAAKTVRVDGGINEGDEVTPHYDPMIAKVITSGDTRAQAIARMSRCLDEFYLRGLNHNIGFLSAIFADADFQAGEISTDFIADVFGEHFDPTACVPADINPLVAVAAVMQRIVSQREATLAGRQLDGRARPGASIPISDDWVVLLNGAQFPVRLGQPNGGVEVRVNGKSYQVETDWKPGEDLFLGQIDGQEICVQIDRMEGGYRLLNGGFQAETKVVSLLGASLLERMPPRPAGGITNQVLSPMPGLLVSVQVEAGQEIRSGEPLAVIEAMKMENQLRAERDGVIKRVLLAPGDSLVVGQVIMEFE